jgi:hypothetical protein
MWRIVHTTDGQHLGLIIDKLPEVGDAFQLGNSRFEIVRIEGLKVFSYNYVITFEKIG